MNPLISTVNDLHALSDRLASTLGGWHPAALQPACLSLSTRNLDAAALRDWLGSLTTAEGWLLYPDQLQVLAGDTRSANLAAYPLSGELKEHSHHLRLSYQGSDRWQLSQTRLEMVADTQKATHLIEPVTQLGTDQAPGALRYWRVWALDTTGTLQPCASLFNGFAGEKA